MTEQQIKDVSHGFLKAWTSGDLKQALSFFAADAVWTTPNGLFKGTAQIEKYLNWVRNLVKDYKITESGVGIVVQGDKAAVEHNLSGTINGMKMNLLSMCTYEFEDGKIANLKTCYDRLEQAQQATKGINKWVVNKVINGAQKGLP